MDAPKPLAVLCPEPLEVGPAPSLRALEREEEELRAALLVDAHRDDEFQGALGFVDRAERQYDLANEDPDRRMWTCKEDAGWPIGQALDELRLVSRRLHQLRESMPARRRR